jgi:hypothetical protein
MLATESLRTAAIAGVVIRVFVKIVLSVDDILES